MMSVVVKTLDVRLARRAILVRSDGNWNAQAPRTRLRLDRRTRSGTPARDRGSENVRGAGSCDLAGRDSRVAARVGGRSWKGWDGMYRALTQPTRVQDHACCGRSIICERRP